MHQALQHSVMSVNKQLCWPESAPQFLPELGGVNSLKYLQLSGMPLQHCVCVCVCVCVSWKRGLCGQDKTAAMQAAGR